MWKFFWSCRFSEKQRSKIFSPNICSLYDAGWVLVHAHCIFMVMWHASCSSVTGALFLWHRPHYLYRFTIKLRARDFRNFTGYSVILEENANFWFVSWHPQTLKLTMTNNHVQNINLAMNKICICKTCSRDPLQFSVASLLMYFQHQVHLWNSSS